MIDPAVRVYVAGPYDLRSDLKQIIERFPFWLQATSRWIMKDYSEEPDRSVPARHDLEDIDKADAVICYVAQRGWGHALEIGYAIAQGKVILLIDAEGGKADWNVFHFHPGVRVVPDINFAIEYLEAWERGGHVQQRKPWIGDRVLDGGEMGTIVVCEECGGSGTLHKPDKEPEVSIPQGVVAEETSAVLHPNSRLFRHILEEVWVLHETKALDYGTEQDPLQNLKAATEFGVPNWIAASIRANDKVQRVKAGAIRAIQTGYVAMANESIIDAFRDASNYFILVEILYREWLHEMGYDRVGDETDQALDGWFGFPEAVEAADANDTLQNVTGAGPCE